MDELAPVVTRRKGLGMQVCVPADWTDEQVKSFADRENLCGTENGWIVNNELGRVRTMQAEGLLTIRKVRGAERLSLTRRGRSALAFEPKIARDKPGLTNR